MKVKTSTNDKTQIKEKIFSAAQKLFVEKGYHNTSMPDIVKKAGVSTGAIYHYFSGKEELAKYIHECAIKEYLSCYNSDVQNKDNTRDKILAYTKLMFEWTEKDPIMVEYMLYSRPKEILNKNVSICAEEGLVSVMKIVTEGIKKKQIRNMDPSLAAAVVSGILLRIIGLKLDKVFDLTLTDIIEETVESIWLAIKV